MFDMATISVAQSIVKGLEKSLTTAKSITGTDLKKMYQLSDMYMRRCGGNSVEPSDFDDLLSSEMGWSDYTISTMMLDGECGNVLASLLKESECDTEEQVIVDLVYEIYQEV